MGWLRRFWPELLLIGLAAALAVLTAWKTSPTADEAKHILDGQSLLERGVGVHEETPSAVLHVLLVDGQDLVRHPYEAYQPAGTLSPHTLFDENPERAQAIKLASRLPTVAIFVLMLVLFAGWARRLLAGRPGAARLALALCALNPTLIAHASVATADLFITATTFASALAVWWFIQRPGTGRAAVLGLVLGLGLVAKIPGLFVLATALGVLGVWAWRAPRGRRLLMLAIVAVLPLVVLAAAYGFHGVGRPLHAVVHESQAFARLDASVLGEVPLPLPTDYVRAIDYSLADGARRAAMGGSYWLMGEAYETAVWSYFPLTLLFKMPLVLLLAFGLGAWRLARWSTRPPWLATCLVAFPAVYLAVNVVLNPFDIGVRYVLPVVPFLALIAGFASDGSVLVTRLSHLLVPVAMALAIWRYPDYLGDYNLSAWFVPAETLLRDSNHDWGQLDYLVAEDLAAHPTSDVCLSLMGPLLEAPAGLRQRDGLQPCRYYVSKSASFVGAMPLITRLLGPPRRTLGGVIEVYELASLRDLPLDLIEDWEMSGPISEDEARSRLLDGQHRDLAFTPYHAPGGLVRAPAAIHGSDRCVLLRSQRLVGGAFLAGGAVSTASSAGRVLPFRRGEFHELTVLLGAVCGDGWYQAGSRPAGATW